MVALVTKLRSGTDVRQVRVQSRHFNLLLFESVIPSRAIMNSVMQWGWGMRNLASLSQSVSETSAAMSLMRTTHSVKINFSVYFQLAGSESLVLVNGESQSVVQ